jgi:hypothetical protein
MKKLGVEWFSDQLVAHVKRGFKVNAYDILYFAEKAFEMQRDEFDQAIWFGIDLEYGKVKRDDRFRSILDQFIHKIKNK